MGYDGSVLLLDPAAQERQLRTWAEQTAELKATQDTVPDWVSSYHRRAAQTVERLDGLEPPPACNMQIGDILLYLTHPIIPGNRYPLSYSVTGSSQNILEVYVPKFLARHSETAATLWRKLMGTDDHYDIELGERPFRFEGRMGGYLTPSERREVRRELKPILAHTDAFYEAAEQYYDKPVDALNSTVIECVYGLCAMGEDFGRRTKSYGLGYRYSV